MVSFFTFIIQIAFSFSPLSSQKFKNFHFYHPNCSFLFHLYHHKTWIFEISQKHFCSRKLKKIRQQKKFQRNRRSPKFPRYPTNKKMLCPTKKVFNKTKPGESEHKRSMTTLSTLRTCSSARRLLWNTCWNNACFFSIN